jgi:methionine-gamma-lyase
MEHQLKRYGRSTRIIHAGAERDPGTRAVAPPICQTSTFGFASCDQGAALFAGQEEGYIYTRMGNPTTAPLEAAVANLEGGAGGLATGSGMAALCTILFALLEQGSHVVGSSSVYGPSRVVVERDFSRFGVSSTFVETSDLDDKAGQAGDPAGFIETPANPTLALPTSRGQRKWPRHNALLVVDNTFSVSAAAYSARADVVMLVTNSSATTQTRWPG